MKEMCNGSKYPEDRVIQTIMKDTHIDGLVRMYNDFTRDASEKIYENNADNAKYVLAGKSYEDVFNMIKHCCDDDVYSKSDDYMWACSLPHDGDILISFYDLGDYYGYSRSIKQECVEILINRLLRILLRLWHENRFEYIPSTMFSSVDKAADDAIYDLFDYAYSNFDGVENDDDELMEKFVREYLYKSTPGRDICVLDIYFLDWNKVIPDFITWAKNKKSE